SFDFALGVAKRKLSQANPLVNQYSFQESSALLRQLIPCASFGSGKHKINVPVAPSRLVRKQTHDEHFVVAAGKNGHPAAKPSDRSNAGFVQPLRSAHHVANLA